MIRGSVRLCLLITILFSLNNLLLARNDTWHAGVARIDITPEDSLWLAGYASRDHGAEGVLHKIWAKALALQDQGGRQAVLVTTDILGFPKNISDHIRKACAEAYKLEKSQIILSSTHSHSGPVLENSLTHIYPLTALQIQKIEQYSRQFEKKIINLVGRALENMTPVKIYSGNGVVRFQVNRRNNDAGTLAEQSDLNGPNDYAVPVLQVREPTGNIKAILFGYACHPTVLNQYQWSGDYPGFAQLALEEKFPGSVALFFQGCGADQNPLPRRSVSLARQYGKELAAAVESVIDEEKIPLTSELKTAYSEIALALNAPPSLEEIEKYHLKSKSGYQRNWAKNMINKINDEETFPAHYPYPIQMWKLGEQLIFALGGEVVVDYAITIKRLFGNDSYVMGYCNDVMGYIPTLRILREGGYEGVSSQVVYDLPSAWRADIESCIISGIIELATASGVFLSGTNLLTD